MNETDVSGKTLLQRMMDYRNRAAHLRIVAKDMHDGSAMMMLGIAASYDNAAETAHAILARSTDLA